MWPHLERSARHMTSLLNAFEENAPCKLPAITISYNVMFHLVAGCPTPIPRHTILALLSGYYMAF